MRSPVERFLEKFEGGGPECWSWNAYVDSDGYGRFSIATSTAVPAHRYSYELFVGPIPEGLELDHTCRNRACVNPSHLEPVTHAENTRRGRSPAALVAVTGLCQKGHPRTPSNTVRAGEGKMRCLTCKRIAERAYRARRGE